MSFIEIFLVENQWTHLTWSAWSFQILQKLVFCTGQIYYELLAEREKRGVDDVALVRLEQIAPFAFDRVAENVAKYHNAELIWAQQEPK
jgi:2-oxoglutarate dehydrogenase E1 component